MSLSAYELERLENIRRNHEHLARLGLADGMVPAAPPAPSAKGKRKASPAAGPSRRSSRLKDMPAPNVYIEHDPDEDEGRRRRKAQRRPLVLGGRDAAAASASEEEEDPDALPVEREEGLRLTPLERRVYSALREIRNAKARSIQRSMFVVCNNRTMVDMCKRVPSSPKELRQCHGMGEVKVEKYGALLLEALAPFADALREEHAAAAAAAAAAEPAAEAAADAAVAVGASTSETTVAAEAGCSRGSPEGEKRRRKKKPRRAVPPDGLSEEELLRMQQEKVASARQHVEAAAAAAAPPSTGASAELPQSIDEVIRLMDEREPAARFFERQIDSSGGCSKTRKRLRDLAATEPDDPAVAWWVAAGGGRGHNVPWTPPDAASLEALINKIKGFWRQ